MMLIEIKFRFSSHMSLGKLCSLGIVTPGSYPVMRVCFVRFSEQENMGYQLKKKNKPVSTVTGRTRRNHSGKSRSSHLKTIIL